MSATSNRRPSTCHIDRFFAVFRNHTLSHIDVKQNLEDLTELVEIQEDDVFILHPGEFVLGSTAERVQLPKTIWWPGSRARAPWVVSVYSSISTAGFVRTRGGTAS